MAFILCREIPSLFQKGLESENVLECDANVNYISRYAPEKLENLAEFIEHFFLGLPRISIICISLLDGDYVNLLGEELIPSSLFLACLLITRFDGNKQPIIMCLPVDSISEEFQPMCSPCKELKPWHCPWSSAVFDDVAPSYRIILEANYLSFRTDVHDEAGYIKWLSERQSYDDQLNNLLKAMNHEWIGSWECLLLGEGLDAKSLKNFAEKLTNSLNSQCDFIFNDNLIKVILSGASSVLDAEACIFQSLLFNGFFGWGGCSGMHKIKTFAYHNKRVRPILKSIKSLISKAVGEGMNVIRQPIILVLDSDVQ
ncbi:separase-like, partial [Phalaenopsis equestris]|uniref:separase-like n=1 Tax=Phalaenopsis equestris TaxID=78828 RepID=UPI0009E18EF4